MLNKHKIYIMQTMAQNINQNAKKKIRRQNLKNIKVQHKRLNIMKNKLEGKLKKNIKVNHKI